MGGGSGGPTVTGTLASVSSLAFTPMAVANAVGRFICVAFVVVADVDVDPPEVITVIPTSTPVRVAVMLDMLLASTPSWLATAPMFTVGAAKLVAFVLGVVVTTKFTTSRDRPRRTRATASMAQVPDLGEAQSVASSAVLISAWVIPGGKAVPMVDF